MIAADAGERRRSLTPPLLAVSHHSSTSFKVEQKRDLRRSLQELGITGIFSSEADLSAMTGTRHVTIATDPPCSLKGASHSRASQLHTSLQHAPK